MVGFNFATVFAFSQLVLAWCEDTIIFPGEFFSDERQLSFKADDKLTLTELKQLNSIKSAEEFLKFFNARDPADFLRIGNTDSPSVAEMANCIPELQTVELDIPDDPQFMHYPTCVRVERCGGCCYGSMLSCQPTLEEDVKLNILRMDSRNTAGDVQPTQITVSKHISCQCQCIIREKDCNLTIQKYDENNCACPCLDQVARTDCLNRKTGIHYWDERNCQCLCKPSHSSLECSTGFYFSHDDCR